MQTEYFITYGCYLELVASKLILTHTAEATPQQIDKYLSSELYELALETTNGWVGSNGFGEEFDSEEEEYRCEEERELVENALEYNYVAWNQEQHAGKCIYGANPNVSTDEWTLRL